MTWLAVGSDVGTMATGLSALTAAVVWTRARYREYREAKGARAARNWNGYIITEGIDTWYVRLVEDTYSERVVLDVVDQDGAPNPQMAHGMRLRIKGDGMLSRSPTQEQWNFLRDIRKARLGPGGGYPIR